MDSPISFDAEIIGRFQEPKNVISCSIRKGIKCPMQL